MKKVISHILAAGFGLWLSTLFIPGVMVTLYSDSNFFGFRLILTWELFVLLGIILGLLNYFVKPILDAITLPLRIITLNLFSFVTGMIILWFVDAIFRELSVPLFFPLLWTTLIIWGLNIILSFIIRPAT